MSKKILKLLIVGSIYLGNALSWAGTFSNHSDMCNLDNIADSMKKIGHWICKGKPLESFNMSTILDICVTQTEVDEVKKYKEKLNELCVLHQGIISKYTNEKEKCQYLDQMAYLVDEWAISDELLEYFLFTKVSCHSGYKDIAVLDLVLSQWRKRRTPETLVIENGKYIWKNSLQDPVLCSFLNLYSKIAKTRGIDILKKILCQKIPQCGPVWLFLFSSAKEVLIKSLKCRCNDGLRDLLKLKWELYWGIFCLKDIIQFSFMQLRKDQNGEEFICKKRCSKKDVNRIKRAHDLVERILFFKNKSLHTVEINHLVKNYEEMMGHAALLREAAYRRSMIIIN